MPAEPGRGRAGGRWLGPRMRAFPSAVTVGALAGVVVLLPVWWDDGAWAAISLTTGYVAALLLLATLLVSPALVRRRRRPAPLHLPLRRSLGVHAGALALVHMAVSFPVHLGGDVARFFVPDEGAFEARFILGNWAGLVANAIFLALLVTSADRALRALGPARWRRLHGLVLVAAALTVLHALAYQSLRSAWLGLAALTLAAAAALALARIAARRDAGGPGVTG